MRDPAKTIPEVRVLIRLLEGRESPGLPAPDAFDDQSEGPWQSAFGGELSSRQWAAVLGRLADLRLVFTNADGMHVSYGLTPLGVQLAKANRAGLPATFYSPTTGTIFLSHSYKDNGFCRSLDFDLRRHGLQTWFDLSDLPAGESIPGKIDYGMRNSNFVVVVYTRNSAMSPWVKLEYETAVYLETTGELDRLVVVKIDDALLPPTLARKSYLFFAKDRYSKAYELPFDQLLSALIRS